MAMEEDTEIAAEDDWVYSGDTIWQTGDIDEALRYECLKMAIDVAPVDIVVKTAASFEGYIRGGSTKLKVV